MQSQAGGRIAAAGESRAAASESRSMPDVDTVLDDDVVEIRRHPQQHLPDDVNQCEVFRVDRGRAARASRQEDILVAFVNHHLHREAAWQRYERGLWQIA